MAMAIPPPNYININEDIQQKIKKYMIDILSVKIFLCTKREKKFYKINKTNTRTESNENEFLRAFGINRRSTRGVVSYPLINLIIAEDMNSLDSNTLHSTLLYKENNNIYWIDSIQDDVDYFDDYINTLFSNNYPVTKLSFEVNKDTGISNDSLTGFCSVWSLVFANIIHKRGFNDFSKYAISISSNFDNNNMCISAINNLFIQFCIQLLLYNDTHNITKMIKITAGFRSVIDENNNIRFYKNRLLYKNCSKEEYCPLLEFFNAVCSVYWGDDLNIARLLEFCGNN
jgi:hypothetical protein